MIGKGEEDRKDVSFETMRKWKCKNKTYYLSTTTKHGLTLVDCCALKRQVQLDSRENFCISLLLTLLSLLQ